MIEVERKFQPTNEQLKGLLSGAESLGTKILEDIYYDYPDYRLFKKDVYFRNRNGNFELKIGDDEEWGVSHELENEKDIQIYFETDKPLIEFINENFIPIIHYKTTREKYKKGEFNIDIDQLDFGYNCVEIELMVEEASQVKDAQKKILELAETYDIEIKQYPKKRSEYFRLTKPEVYKRLYEEK